MVLVNYTTRELTAKLVYYGPGLCGKTTNLQYIFESLLPPDRRGKMVSLATETDRTLFFDFLPLEIGKIRGLTTRLQLYTVPGQVHYNATRKIVLKGADGIVFVADSQRSMRQANKESFQNMKDNLKEHGLDLGEIPHVIQFNKRDLPDIMNIEEMFEDLNEYNVPFWEAVAVEGVGVEDTLKSLVKLVLKNLATKFAPGSVEEAEAAVPDAKAPAPAPAPAAPFEEEEEAAEPAAPRAEAAPVAEPIEAQPEAEAESPLMTSTGELLALEFESGSGGTPVPPASEKGEVLEVGDEALVLEDEPPTSPKIPAAQEAEPFGSEPEEAPAEEEPFGAEDESGSGDAPEPSPESAVADEASSALDGLDLGAPLDEPEPAPAAAAPDEGNETVMLRAETPARDLEMPELDGDAGGDTMLSPEGDLEGLATEADLPGAGAESGESEDSGGLDLTDVPELPDLEPSAPAAAASPAAQEEEAAEAEPAAQEEAAEPAEEVLDLPATLSLGQVEGEVERTLRMPVEWTDGTGRTRQRLLEVRLRFRLN